VPAPGAAAASSSAPHPPLEDLPPSIEDFDELIDNEVAKYVSLSHGLGGLIEEQVCTQ
jgi:adenylyl cyclase-associated protein